jgi:phosphate transport system substrate-binding protein
MFSHIRQILNGYGFLLALVFIAGLILAAGGCAPRAPEPSGSELSGSFKVIGSNTVTPLTTLWAEEFMKLNPEVNIAVSGPGSGVGIASLINGTIDIAQVSRGMKTKEYEQAAGQGVNPYEIQMATDALSVTVHPSNPVSEMTITQLSAIFTNQVTNWQDVGGDDAPIVAIARDTNSGTHVFFKEQVIQMKGLDTENKELEYGQEVLFLPSTEGGITETANNPNAIFYPGLGYLTDEVKALAVKKTADDPAVLPSVVTALDGTYAVARPLLYYTDGEPAGIIKAFIDFCLSPEGQAKVIEAGYVPLQ